MSTEYPHFFSAEQEAADKDKKAKIANYFRQWAEKITPKNIGRDSMDDDDLLRFANRLQGAADALSSEILPPGSLGEINQLLHEGVNNELNYGDIAKGFNITRDELLEWRDYIEHLLDTEISK